MSPLFNILSRLVITFLPRSKCLLISWLQTPSALIFGAPQNEICHCFHCFPIYLPWSDGTRCHDLSFWMLSFKPAFALSSFTFIKRLFSASLLSAIRVVSSAHLRLLTCIQISQEAGKVIWYSHLFKNFPVCCESHSQRLWHSQWSRCFSGTLLLFLWTSGCWQLDLWFLCLF